MAHVPALCGPGGCAQLGRRERARGARLRRRRRRRVVERAARPAAAPGGERGRAALLYGKAVNLDGQPYAVTIAVPRGMRAGTCKSDLSCTVKRLPSGHAVLQWEKSDGRDVAWEVKFRSVGQTQSKTPSRTGA